MKHHNIIIASQNPNLYTTQRLMTEAKKLKHSPIWINPYTSILPTKLKKKAGLYFHRTTGITYDDFDLVVARFHELSGMTVTNSLCSLRNFRSKDQQALFFLENQFPTIPTLHYRGEITDNLRSEINKLSPKNHHYILKMVRGNQGIGVNFIQGEQSLYSFLETFHAMKDQRFLIQPHVPHKKEWRFFVIKEMIIACIEKNLDKSDFRGNAKRSQGKFLKKIPPHLASLVLEVFQKSQLDYAGIDVLECPQKGPLLLEVNPIPGFEQAEKLSGKNIARELLIH